MPSPFPGMDPYLESYLWSDVHTALANKIRQQLTPQLRPRYTARLEIYLVEDPTPEAEVGILYPDAEILRVQPIQKSISSAKERAIATTLTLTLPVLQPVEIRIPTVEIRDTAKNVLVTCIEILSPVNKREPGLSVYRQKRQRLYQAGVNLVELDFLRRGTRLFNHPRIPNVPYIVALTCANSGRVNIWTIKLQDQLPILPVPLRAPDADVSLDLPSALNAIYEEAAYDLSIDYSQPPPPPPLSESDTEWMEVLTRFR